MSAIGTELVLIFGLLILNGLLAMSEMALVTARRARLQQRADRGSAGARAALALGANPNRFLSTVQIGITAVGILAGAFGGATLTSKLTELLGLVPLLAPYREPLAFALVVLGITYCSLIVGELVPKQVALAHPEVIASLVARPLGLLARGVAPAVSLLSVSSTLVLRLLRVKPRAEDVVSDEEIRLLIQQGTHSGVFEPVEQELMEGALELGDELVADLMTPRPRVVWLDVEDAPDENWSKIAASSHISFPVCEGDLDHVLGIVSVKQLWEQQLRGETADLRALPLTSPTFVHDRLPAIRLLEVLQQPEVHLVLVIDEHGSITGVVSLGDLTEAMVGDAALLGKRRDHQAVARDDGSWLLDGLMPLDDVWETLGLEDGLEETDRYQSLGGLIFGLIGTVPRVGDAVVFGPWRFEVLDMDGRRIDKVLATRIEEPPISGLAARRAQ